MYVNMCIYIYIGIYFLISKCYCKLSDQTYPHIFMFFDVLLFFSVFHEGPGPIHLFFVALPWHQSAICHQSAMLAVVGIGTEPL